MDRPFRDRPPTQSGRCLCVCREKPQALKLLHREGHGLTLYTRKLDGVCFPKIEVDEEKNECIISYATFVKMAIGERLWGSAQPY